MPSKTNVSWAFITLLIGLVRTDDELKSYLKYILENHQQSSPQIPVHQPSVLLRQPLPAPLPASLFLHMMDPKMYSPLHQACDHYSKIEKNLMKGYDMPAAVRAIILPNKAELLDLKKKKSLIKMKWNKAKFMLKGSLEQALNNNHPYYPLDPTAGLKSAGKSYDNKGVVVLRDKLGLQVFSNHPVTILGNELDKLQATPGYTEEEETDQMYKPLTYQFSKPGLSGLYGMPAVEGLEPVVKTVIYSSEKPYASSEMPSTLKTFTQQVSDPTTEQQQLFPTTTVTGQPSLPYLHKYADVTESGEGVQMQQQHPTSTGMMMDLKGIQENNVGEHVVWKGRKEVSIDDEEEVKAGGEEEEGRNTDPSADAGKQLIMHGLYPPGSMVHNSLDLTHNTNPFNSSGSEKDDLHGESGITQRSNQGWKPVTRDPRGDKHKPKITFEVQTGDSLSSTDGDQTEQEIVGEGTLHHVSWNLEPVHKQLRSRVGTASTTRTTTSSTKTAGPDVAGTSSDATTTNAVTTTASRSTPSSIILTSSASYFSSLDPSLSTNPSTRTS